MVKFEQGKDALYIIIEDNYVVAVKPPKSLEFLARYLRRLDKWPKLERTDDLDPPQYKAVVGRWEIVFDWAMDVPAPAKVANWLSQLGRKTYKGEVRSGK